MFPATSIVLIICFIIQAAPENQTNYISNGGFEIPAILPTRFTRGKSYIWTGNYEVKGSNYSSYAMGFGQYVDLGITNYQNGYAQQSVILPENGKYRLTFLQRAPKETYYSHIAEIYWNQNLIATMAPNTTAVTTENIQINATAGNNTLKFVEVGDDFDVWGLYIDEVSLYLIEPENQVNATLNQTNANITNGALNHANITNETQTLNQIVHKDHQSEDNNTIFDILSIVLALPLNQLPSLKFSAFLAEDLWLYYYNPRQYDGLAHDIFKTIVVLEKMKFRIVTKLIDIDRIIAMFPLSDYSEYTQPKFQEIETSDSVFFKVVFTFIVFTIPSNILMCFIFYQIFKAIYKYKASTIFRRYYFFGPAFLQIIFEGNIAYFTFCCFNHLTNAFSFRFADKLSLLFTIMFLFILLLLSVCFYLCIGKLLEKKSCYFIYCFYRCHQAYCYLAVYNMGFEFIKGCLHYFLLKKYGYLMASLCVLECFIIIYTIYMEKIHQIFIPKSMFSCYLCYHFCFILLNISLYVEELNKHMGRDTSFILSTQQVVIISMITFNGLMMIVDLIPYEYVKPKDTFREEFEDDVAYKVYHQNRAQNTVYPGNKWKQNKGNIESIEDKSVKKEKQKSGAKDKSKQREKERKEKSRAKDRSKQREKERKEKSRAKDKSKQREKERKEKSRAKDKSKQREKERKEKSRAKDKSNNKKQRDMIRPSYF